MKLITQSEMHEYPFSFTNIPFENHTKMRDKIDALDFGNHKAPVSVTLKEFVDRDPSFAKVSLNVINHSNEDIMSISTNLEYLDASSTKLEDFPTMISGTFSSDGWSKVVEKNDSAVQEATTFNMPTAIQKLNIIIQRIEFADGTEWGEQ